MNSFMHSSHAHVEMQIIIEDISSCIILTPSLFTVLWWLNEFLYAPLISILEDEEIFIENTLLENALQPPTSCIIFLFITQFNALMHIISHSCYKQSRHIYIFSFILFQFPQLSFNHDLHYPLIMMLCSLHYDRMVWYVLKWKVNFNKG